MLDELARPVALAGPPQRIVSLVPSLTEYVVWLGAGARLVGRTEFCVAPAAAVAAIPTLRGTKNPDLTALQALQPDLVLASKEENRERDVAALAAAGVQVYVTDVTTVRGAHTTLARLAELLDCAVTAAPLLAEIEAELALAPPPALPLVAAIWRDPWMLVGADTYASDLLRCCGGSNLAAALDGRYPRVTLAELAALAPALTLLPDEPYAFGPADAAELAPLLERVALCDGTLLTWYGPRLPAALRQLRALLRT